MYSLLIVDDEPLVQVGIKSMLNWQELNIQICGIAMNGKAALDIIESEVPDIVITDIKMPIMSGLELIRICKERYGKKTPSFIILTSYEDFHMAKEALKYQVSDYLVKLELNAEHLREAILRVLEKKETSLSEMKSTAPSIDVNSFYDKYFIKLLNNLFESDEQQNIQRNNLGITFDSDQLICAHIEVNSKVSNSLPVEKQINLFNTTLQMLKELIVKYIPAYVISLDLHHCAIIFMADQTMTMKKLTEIINIVGTTLQKYYNVTFRIGIGTFVSRINDVSDSYQSARRAFTSTSEDNLIITSEDFKSYPSANNIFNISLFKDSLVRAFEEYNDQSLYDTINSIIDLFTAHPSHYLQALDGACNILYLSLSLLPNGESLVSGFFQNETDNYRALYKSTSMDQIIDWLIHFRDALCKYFVECNKDHKNHIVITVKKYISTHIRERLTLNDVANNFSISPNYLSQLFKKYNDMGFNEFITYLKIQEAKKLLSESNLKIYEVADMLGFESAFYFSKVFKKVEGISPTDHQNNKGLLL